MRRKSLWLAVIAGAGVLASCGVTPIGRITADPSRFVNRSVRVQGTVTNAYGVLGTGGYQIQDSTGKIYVLSGTGVPNKGSRVEVTGTVMSGMSIAGRSVGTAVRESYHKLK
jgi:hypothetical protein